MKEIGVFGAKKRTKTLSGNGLDKNLFEEEAWGDILYLQDNVLI